MWTKVRAKFFLFDSEFDSERASGIISTSDSNQKLRNFKVVYLPSYPFDSIKDILGA
jgi:hypothetical protein